MNDARSPGGRVYFAGTALAGSVKVWDATPLP